MSKFIFQPDWRDHAKHSGLNLIFWCLKMKSVLNKLDYFLEQFQISSWGLQPLEYILNDLNWFHLVTTRKSCWQPEMSGWIQVAIEIMTCFIYILDSSNSSSLTFWTSQFTYSSRCNWTGISTGNSNDSWTDKHSSHFSTAKEMSVKATFFFL